MLFWGFCPWVNFLYIILTCVPLSSFPPVKLLDILDAPEVVLVFEYVEGREFSHFILLKLSWNLCPSSPLVLEQINHLVICKHELWCPDCWHFIICLRPMLDRVYLLQEQKENRRCIHIFNFNFSCSHTVWRSDSQLYWAQTRRLIQRTK